MTSYPEYKATNLPWLPQIPTHWEMMKNKYLLKQREDVSETGDELLLSLSQYTGITAKKLSSGRLSETLVGYKIVHKNDIVMNIMLAWNGSTAMSTLDGVVSPAYAVFQVTGDTQPKFLHYLFKIPQILQYFKAFSFGVIESRLRLYPDELAKLFSIIPPVAEQEQIVRYLDSMTAKINKLIRAKKKQIALLQEQKQAIINQAVTKGLNPNAEMKDSGIDWLGQIPAHWAIKKFSKVASIKSNLVKPENYYDYPQVSPDKIEKHTGKLLPVISVKDAGIISNNHLFFKGQILYSKIRPLLNKVAIAPFDGLCSADMYPIETILETEYLKFFMLSTWFLYQIKQSGDRAKMPKINQEEMAKLEIVIPSKHEQKDIVRSIYECWNQIDMVLKSLEKSIQTLSEYKNSLIASVVTGQVDIRNIQVENFDPADLISDTDDDPVEDDDQPQEESEE